MNLALQGGGEVEVAEAVFARSFNEALVHQVVNAQLAAFRSGSRAQKTRAEARGGGRKPWRQKGGGRARAGSIRSPIWRGGGVAFAAKPQNHAQKVNRKMYRGAVRCILSELLRQGRLVVVEDFSIDAPKTSALIGKIKSLEFDEVLIVVAEHGDGNLQLAARNLRSVDLCAVADLDPVRLIGSEKVLMTVAALKQLQEALA